MSFVVTVRFVSRPDSGQPEPFYIESGAEWPTLKLMLSALDGGDSQLQLDVRYWDEEDYVIISSQEELDEALRLANDTGLLQLYVRRTDDLPEHQEQLTEPTAPTVEEEPRERAPKRRAEEAFTPEQQENGSPVDPSASPSVTICLQAEDTAVKAVLYQPPDAAAGDPDLCVDDGVSSAQNLQADGGAVEAGAADQEHIMLPGAQSGANVIAIEMPECPLEVVQQEEAGEHQGTEAAEPAEMAETGEMAHKSGRDAETGFWMVAKSEHKGETNQAKPRPKQPVSKSPSQVSQKKTEAKVGSSSSNPDKAQRKKKHHADALTQEVFLDYMSKYKSEMRREIVKDVTRKTVRQVVEGVGKLQADQQRVAQTGKEDGSPQERRFQWPVCFHEKIVCDECEQTIIGPRYKCGNCTNYDLCEGCESIYPPVHDSTHVFVKLRIPCPKAGIRRGERIPLLKRPVYLSTSEEDKKDKEKLDLDRLAKVKEKLLKKEQKLKRRLAEFQMGDMLSNSFGVLSAKFLADLTIPDGTTVTPGQCLEKKWAMRNNGTLSWPAETTLEVVQGTMTAKEQVVPVGAVAPGEIVTLTVELIAPEKEGDYESRWRLSNKGMVFGHFVFCKVHVWDPEAVDYGPCEPKDVTPTCENPVESSPAPAAGAELPVVPEETLNEEGACENPTETQDEEQSTEKGEEDRREKALVYLQRLDRVEPSEGATPHTDDGAEARDLWVPSRFQAEPKLSGNGASTSPAVPSTPNNTPFAVSPPSGRCVSPLPASASSGLVKAFLEAQQHELASAEEGQQVNSLAVAGANWMKEYLLEMGHADAEAAKPQGDVPPAKKPLYSILRFMDAVEQPSEESPAYNETEHEDLVFLVKNDDDNTSCPELLFDSDFVVCPSHKGAAEDLAADAESVDEELYTSASLPKTSKLEAALEMPIVGPSPVMPSEDSVPEVLVADVLQNKGEASLHRQLSREMSPGSTVSSVEVVSEVDMEQFEKELREEFGSSDTNGAWFASGQLPNFKTGKDDLENYEILEDSDKDHESLREEFSRCSDDSSSEEDFCIIMPPCFDPSVPLTSRAHARHTMDDYRNSLKEMEHQWDTNALFQDARENLEEVTESAAVGSAGHSEQAEESVGTVQTSSLVPEDSEVKTLCLEPALVKQETEEPQQSSGLLPLDDHPVPLDIAGANLLMMQKICEQHRIIDAEMKGEPLAEADEKSDISSELQQSNQQMDRLVDFLTTKMKKLGDTASPEDEGKVETENGSQEAQNEETDKGELDSQTKEPALEDVTGNTEETEMKATVEDEDKETAAAAPVVTEAMDPGQQLNQLMQSTVKAATSGLQHLYRTTKDVIKTLQADPYEPTESTYEFQPTNFVLPKSTWQPPTTQYVPPRNDYQPPKSDYQLPKSTYTGPKPPETSVSDEFAIPLMRIREMGYFNNERSIALLKKHNGDVHRVVDELCQESDNDWAMSRH